MKECPVCRRCFPDHVNHCPDDGDATTLSIAGEPILDGRYQLERRIGHGGMGVVFQARHIFLKTAHAIKVILPDLVGNDPMLVTRFRQEALAAAAIRHQNIIAVTDFGVVRGTMPFLVMEFVSGKSLHEILAAEGALPPARALEILAAVGAGVGAAHRQGIIHRDLKPLNIMLQEGLPTAEAVKVLDFGLAKIKSGELLGSFVQAKTSGLMGSPFYMAPEQWGDEEPDARADIYSLGVILFQMIGGDVPFKGTSIPSIMKKHLTAGPPTFASLGVNVPPQIEGVVRHALEKESENRPASVEEFVQELRDAISSLTSALKSTQATTMQAIQAETMITGPHSIPPDATTLRIKTDPPHARVYINNVSVGMSDQTGLLVVSDMLRGLHRVNVMHDGYAAWEQQVECSGGVCQIEARLQGLGGTGSPLPQASVFGHQSVESVSDPNAGTISGPLPALPHQSNAAMEAQRLRQQAEALEEQARREEEEMRHQQGERERLTREAEEQRQAAAEAARVKALEEERARAEAEARARAEEERLAAEALARAEEEERRRAEEEAARLRAEEEARLKAEEEAARLKAEEEARLRALEEERVRAAEEARRAAEEAARLKAEQEAARLKAEEEEAARLRAEEEARRKAEEEKAARAREEEAAARRAEEARIAAEALARRLAEEEAARRRAEEAERLRVEEQARIAAEERAAAEEQAAAEERAARQQREREEQAARIAATINPQQLPPSELDSTQGQRQGVVTQNLGSDSLQGIERPAADWRAARASAGQGAAAQAPPLAPPRRTGVSTMVIAAIIGVLLVGGGLGVWFMTGTKQQGTEGGEVKQPPQQQPPGEQPPGEQQPPQGQGDGGEKGEGDGKSFKPETVSVPGGRFDMGREGGALQEGPVRHNVTVGGFVMDKTEVTNQEYADFVRETKHEPPSHWKGPQPADDIKLLPVVFVSYRDAVEFAAWRSKRDGVKYRLPTEEEWEYAAKGGDQNNLYPWGNAWVTGNAGTKDSGATQPRAVGSYPQDKTRWGVLDMAGNVYEWTSSRASLYPGSDAQIDPSHKNWVVIRGGAYVTDHKQKPPTTWRDWFDPSRREAVIGFRLVRAGAEQGNSSPVLPSVNRALAN